MKKIIFGIVSMMIAAFALMGCGENAAKEDKKPDDPRVEIAIDAIKEEWKGVYKDWGQAYDDMYLEIINTQVVKIKDSVEEELFDNVDYVVAFDLMSNFFGTGEPYVNVKYYDCVLIYKDGSVSVGGNIFKIYTSKTYSRDFSGIIEEVIDYKGKYDQVLVLK